MANPETSLELDQMSIRILEVLEQHGGTATTSELKNVIGVDTTDLLNYRKRKYLEPAGLIDTFQPEVEKPGEWPAQEWSLTEKALEFLENREEGSGDFRDLGERVSLLEDQLDEVQEQLTELQGKGVADKQDRSGEGDLQTQITSIASTVNDLESTVEVLKKDALFQEEYRWRINTALIASIVSKDMLVDEHGEDTMRQRFEEKEEELDLIPEDSPTL